MSSLLHRLVVSTIVLNRLKKLPGSPQKSRSEQDQTLSRKALGKSRHFSEAQFPHWYNGGLKVITEMSYR